MYVQIDSPPQSLNDVVAIQRMTYEIGPKKTVGFETSRNEYNPKVICASKMYCIILVRELMWAPHLIINVYLPQKVKTAVDLCKSYGKLNKTMVLESCLKSLQAS